MTHFVSWNVNGLRAVAGKNFAEAFARLDADVFCLQETKLQAGQLSLELPGYRQYWNYAERKGYSGTAVFSRREPLSVRYGLGIPQHDTEGRVITLEFDDLFVVTVYTPNSQDGLARLPYRLEWEEAFLAYIRSLDAEKPVVFGGDLNVAHEPIDLKNPQANRKNPGFSDEERQKLSELLAAGYVDTFRAQHPGLVGAYSWWSYRFGARERNAGWRIDYWLVSERLFPRVADTQIYAEITGSDHCPVGLTLKD